MGIEDVFFLQIATYRPNGLLNRLWSNGIFCLSGYGEQKISFDRWATPSGPGGGESSNRSPPALEVILNNRSLGFYWSAYSTWHGWCLVGQTTPNKIWRSFFRIYRLPLIYGTHTKLFKKNVQNIKIRKTLELLQLWQIACISSIIMKSMCLWCSKKWQMTPLLWMKPLVPLLLSIKSFLSPLPAIEVWIKDNGVGEDTTMMFLFIGEDTTMMFLFIIQRGVLSQWIT